MKILYGVCGEGFGHSSRAKEMIKYLEKEGHKVLVMTYGQAYSVLKDFKRIKVEGFTLLFKNNKLHLGDTIAHSIKIISKNVKNWREIKKKIDRFGPELCISDMEPIVPIVSFHYRLPLISIDNQHRLTHLKLKVPKKYVKDYLTARIATDSCISRAKAFIILSFTKGKTKGKNAYVVSPILRKEILRLKPTRADKILVYQTKPNKKLITVLEKIPRKFIVYGYDKKEKKGNLEFKKAGKGFIKDLARCRAIIATSGFTLISEALYLKKPYFALPLGGQFEQVLNALFLKNSGIGTFSENPTEKEIVLFLKNLKEYEKKLRKHKMDSSEAIRALEGVMKKIHSRIP